MQPAMTAADLLAQLMTPLPHSTPAALPCLPPFFPTQHQHQPTGHTVPQPMQPPFASVLSHCQHATLQHSHAGSSATSTLQHSHTRLSGITATVWFILYVPAHITSNQHNTGTTNYRLRRLHNNINNNIHMLITTQFPPSTFNKQTPPCGCSEAVLNKQPWLTAKSGLETFTTFVNFHCKHPFSHT